MKVCSKTYVINKLIEDNGLESYLEVGVSNPYQNYMNVRCRRKASVDPCVRCEHHSPESVAEFGKLVSFRKTSDEFFAGNSEKYDLIFVDGDHSGEQSLKDLNNALAALNPGGFVVMHDACPVEEAYTSFKNFEEGKPYTGDVWKTVMAASRTPGLEVKVFPFDYGVAVVRKKDGYEGPVAPVELEYGKDYGLDRFECVVSPGELARKKVSYFTSLHNLGEKSLARTASCVLRQTCPDWEWVVVDDSDDVMAAGNKAFFSRLADPRIRYFRLSETSGGFIGKAKRRACSLCEGDWLAELDHDDLIMPGLTGYLLSRGEGYDFVYTNSASVTVDDSDNLGKGETYGEGFAMGYGSYRKTKALNPLNGALVEFDECVCCPINPKTIRHIVGIPNHLRAWRKEFYWRIGGHDERLWVGDDYDLVIRSFVNGGRFLHIDWLGYLQTHHESNATDERRAEIQVMVASLVAKYDKAINSIIKRSGLQDWAYDFCDNFAKFREIAYWVVPNVENSWKSNDVVKID